MKGKRTHGPPGRLTVGWGLEPAMHGEHDYLRSTGHLAAPERDYANFRKTGATVARSGLRTRFANPARGTFDFEDAARQARAARDNGIFVYWDLCHYDLPRWIGDPWSGEAADAVADLGAAFADRLRAEGVEDFGICAWNEIILWSLWMETGSDAMTVAGAAEGGAGRRGKWRELGVRTAFAVMEAVGKRHPRAKFLIAEPAHREGITSLLEEMRAYRPDLMDRVVIGLNMYPITEAPFTLEDPVSYFVPLVADLRREYPRNEIVISETSSVGNWGLPDRMAWFRKMRKVQRLSNIGTMIWYPAIDYGAWHDESVLVEHGAWGQDPERTEYAPLVRAVSRANGALKPAALGR